MKPPSDLKMSELNSCVHEIQVNENKLAMNKLDLFDNHFERLFLEVLDQELSTLGDSCRETIYSLLKSAFGIEKQEIPDKIELFTNALEDIFGESAKVLEIAIIRAVCQRVNKFKYFPKYGKIVLAEYLIAVRSFLQAKS